MGSLLDLVGLKHIKKYITTGEAVDWANVLDTNALKQKFALARVLLARPEFLFLEGTTSALSRQDEKVIYTFLKAAKTLIITAGNWPELVDFHTRVLRINNDGTTQVYSSEDYKKTVHKGAEGEEFIGANAE
jgi:vitamin B12/bleomycin/antimicrobial peptide transport system ATP-binding/permease protein